MSAPAKPSNGKGRSRSSGAAPTGTANRDSAPERSSMATSEESTYGASRRSRASGWTGSWSSISPFLTRPTWTSARTWPVRESSSDRRASPKPRLSTRLVTRSFSQAAASDPVTRVRRHAERSTNAQPCSRERISCSPTFVPAYGGHGRPRDPGRDQRLPAPRGRGAAVRVQRRTPPAARPGRGGRAELARVARARCRAPVPRIPVPAHLPVADRRAGRQGPLPGQGARLGGGAVRPRAAAGAARSWPRTPRPALRGGHARGGVLVRTASRAGGGPAGGHLPGLAGPRREPVHRAGGSHGRPRARAGEPAPAGGRRRAVPAGPVRRRGPPLPRHRPRSPAGGVRVPAGPQEGPGRADPGHSPDPPAGSPTPTFPPTTPRPTCSPCPAGLGWAAWRSRGSGSYSWRPRRRASRWWRGNPVGRRRPSRTARPGWWWTGATRAPWRRPWRPCWPIRDERRPWERPAGPGWSGRSPGLASRRHWRDGSAQRQDRRHTGAKGDHAMPGDTVTKRFHDQVAALGDRTAMRGRGPEGWRELSWNEFGRAVRETALGLIALGVQLGDAVCILSGNRPEWHVADYATLAADARSAPIYTSNSPHQVAYIAAHAEARVIFVDTEEQLRKVEKVRPDLPALQHVVFTDEYPESPDGFVLSLPALREHGRALDAEQPGLYDERWQSASPEDVATVVYTSGTTGPPQGAMLTHANVVWTSGSLLQVFQEQQGTGRRLSYLPLSHIAERMTSEFAQSYIGCEVWFAESLDTVARDLADCRPTVFFAVPRVWEKFYAGINAKLATLPEEQRGAAEGAIYISKAVVEMQQAGDEVVEEMQHGLHEAEEKKIG